MAPKIINHEDTEEHLKNMIKHKKDMLQRRKDRRADLKKRLKKLKDRSTMETNSLDNTLNPT